MPAKQGLDLDRVVLLGRTLEEYQRFFGLDLADYRSKAILDVAGGVSSFTAETRALGFNVTALDRIYSIAADDIRAHCERDLAEVTRDIAHKPVYRWKFYKSPEGMRSFRERAYQTFLAHYTKHPDRYVAGQLPHTPFTENQFALTLASYLLFVYEDQLTYDFHKDTLRELMRITSEEIRIYPIVTFEAAPSKYLQRICQEAEFSQWSFEIIATNFEFLRNSNCYLKIVRAR